MQRRKMPEVHNSHPNVTPLIDVVMCLIIFFMLIAKIGVSTGAEDITIPATLRGVEIKDLGNTLLLNVRQGAGDDPLITALVEDHKAEIKVRELAALLKQFRHGKPGEPKENPGFSIIIRAEESLKYSYLEPILMAAAEAGVERVSYNTRNVMVSAPVKQ